MKKIISAISFFITVSIFSQEKIGSYASEFFDDKTFEVTASKPKVSGKYTFYIDVESRDKLIKHVSLVLDNDKADKFKEVLQLAKTKYQTWSKTAKDNNVDELDKEMEDCSFKLGAAFHSGSKWRFDYHVKLKFRAKILDGSMYLIIQNKSELTSSSNQYIDCKGFYIVFASVSEIETFINQLNHDKVISHFKGKGKKEELFK